MTRNTQHATRYNRVSERFLTMLALLAAFLMSYSGARAQPNAEYDFKAYPYYGVNDYSTLPSGLPGVGDGVSFDGTNVDDMPILTMDCLAANGYGQWTMTTHAGAIDGSKYGAGWYLLENALSVPANNASMCIPPGVVANGSWSSGFSSAVWINSHPTLIKPLYQAKVTANLDGYVSYVFPSADRKHFHIEWFGPSDIDISLSNIPNNGSAFPSGTQIVKNGQVTHSYDVTTSDGTNYHDIINNETYYQDLFSVCSDAHYLYITWCSQMPTGSASTIYEMQIDLANQTQSTPIPIGFGSRPTIACDVRFNRGTGSTVWYEIGYVMPGGSGIGWYYYHGSPSLSGMYPVNNDYVYEEDGAETPFTGVEHVCALVSSVAGGSQHSALYALVYEDLGTDLVMYNLSITDYVVDGGLLSSNNAWDAAVANGPWEMGSVVDAPIVAFANPYDNRGTWQQYDQFHCIYQLDLIDGTPLWSVRNADIAEEYPTCPDPLNPDTRTCVSTYDPDTYEGRLPNPTPGEYVAAVNQMGIHVHWRALDPSGIMTHYYMRDWRRTFDEPIDENTLVTDICRVTDGSSAGTGGEKGGTFGATVTGNYRMTVWSDPNYATTPGTVTNGIYQANNTISTGGLYIGIGDGTTATNGLRLSVGDGTSGNSATFTMCPNSVFVVDNVSTGQGLTINGNSLFDYYGLSNIKDNTLAITGANALFSKADIAGAFGLLAPPHPLPPLTPLPSTPLSPDGGGDIFLSGTSSLNANMNVHGGADFLLNELSTFESTYGNIDIKYEPNIFPINSSGAANGDASGVMEFECPATFTHSTVTGNFPSASASNVMVHVMKCRNAGMGGPVGQITSSYTNYSNSSSDGLAVVRFDNSNTGGTIEYGNSSFTNDNFDYIQIVAIDPQNNFDIETSNFNGATQSLHYVDIELQNYTTYGYIYINGSYFYPRATAEGTSSSDLYVEGFNTLTPVSNDNSDVLAVLDHIDIDGNYFYENDVTNYGTIYGANLDLSNGVIQNNSQWAPFSYGIAVSGNPFGLKNNLSLLCSNTLGSAALEGPQTGIQTSYHQGYIMLNQISYCYYYGLYNLQGSIGSDNAVPHLLGNVIYNSYFGPGVAVQSGVVDMSGLHHGSGGNLNIDGPGDLAGYNQVYNNCSENSFGQINLGNSGSNVWVTQNGSSTWTAAGLNNIYQGTSPEPELIVGTVDESNPTVDISNNYWGSGVTPPAATPPYNSLWPWLNFTSSSVSTASSTSGLSCSGGGGIAGKQIGAKPLSIATDTDTCSTGFPDYVAEMNSNFMYRQAYDTMRYWYIPHCYPMALAPETAGALDGSAQLGVVLTDYDSVLNFRDFAIHCLTLRNDDEWFCAFVGAVAGTYVDSNNIYHPDYRAERTIAKYLTDNPRCAYAATGDAFEEQQLLETQWNVWNDSANIYFKDPPFDSSIPSMHDLGLDTILKLNAQAGVTYAVQGTQIILDARVTENPFPSATSIWLSIGREAYIHIEVFDLLGRAVSGAGYAGVFEQGSREIPLDMSKAPPGTYYVRVSTANNEVRTLKITKE